MSRSEGRSDAARLLLAAARERFAVAATDLLLPEQARLTEWQRLTAANLLTRLIRSIEDEMRALLAERFTDHDALHAGLSSAHVPIALPILERAGVLRDTELGTVLVRRVEEHRFWRARSAVAAEEEMLLELVRDGDPEVAGDAMALVIARSRRFDRFQEPIMGPAELPAELHHRLVWLIAAALRHYMVQQHGLAAPDAAIAEVSAGLIAAHDEGEGLEPRAMRLARRLQARSRLSGPLLLRVLGDGVLPLFIAGLAVRNGLDHNATWEVISDPRGRGPAILLRAAGLERDEAAATLLALSSHGRLFSGTEGDTAAAQLELYDSIGDSAARDILRLWQADPFYRACVARLSTRARPASEAA